MKQVPDKPLYQLNVADALRQLHQPVKAKEIYSKAIQGYRRALKTNRMDDESRALMAMGLAAIGQCDEASDETREVLSRHANSPQLSAYAAIAATRCGNESWAKEIVLRSISKDNLLMIRFDPDLKSIRQLPEIKEALNRIHQPST
jgi:tetratricopeptide (TPR) repeat protein